MVVAGDVYLDSLLTRKVTMRNFATDKVLHNRISDSSICTTGIKYDYLTHYTTFPYYIQFDSSTYGIIGANTADGYDNKSLTISGAGMTGDAARGAWMTLLGNDRASGGNIHMSSGDTGFVVLFTGRGIEFPFYANRDSGKIVLEPHTIGGKSSALFGCKNDTAGVLMIHAGQSITKGIELRHDTVHVKARLVVDSTIFIKNAASGFSVIDGQNLVIGGTTLCAIGTASGPVQISSAEGLGTVTITCDSSVVDASSGLKIGLTGAKIQSITRHIDTIFIDFGDTVLNIRGIVVHDDTTFYSHGWGVVATASYLYHIKDSSGTWVSIGDSLKYLP